MCIIMKIIKEIELSDWELNLLMIALMNFSKNTTGVESQHCTQVLFPKISKILKVSQDGTEEEIPVEAPIESYKWQAKIIVEKIGG